MGHVFNQDPSKWDVSKVTDMSGMFQQASAFNADIKRWDVSSVTRMDRMFQDADAFSHTLCAAAWLDSKASQVEMFKGAGGGVIAICTTPTTTTTTTTTTGATTTSGTSTSAGTTGTTSITIITTSTTTTTTTTVTTTTPTTIITNPTTTSFRGLLITNDFVTTTLVDLVSKASHNAVIAASVAIGITVLTVAFAVAYLVHCSRTNTADATETKDQRCGSVTVPAISPGVDVVVLNDYAKSPEVDDAISPEADVVVFNDYLNDYYYN